MTLPHRRRFLRLAAGVAALPTMSRIASAQAFPARPVRFIVPVPAGGPIDVLARLYGQKLSQRWNQPVVIENRAGATGTIGTEVVVRAPPDGYTLLFTVDLPITMAPALLKPRYTPTRPDSYRRSCRRRKPAGREPIDRHTLAFRSCCGRKSQSRRTHVRLSRHCIASTPLR